MAEDKRQNGPDCDFDKNVYDSGHTCNKFLLRTEFQERNNIVDNDALYPTLNDPNFSLKIASKQEFNETQYDGTIHDVEERANILANMEFELSPHQMFVKNFLSLQTPYNSLLLFHGLGTGKTCSAIGICEEYRDYLRQSNQTTKIIIVASPTVQENFRIQLFNEQLLKMVNGEWTINNCVGGKLINEINPTHTKNISKEKIIQKVNKIINTYYEFVGYREFSNYIERKQTANVDFKKWSTEEQLTRMKRNLKLEFDNRLICIDEVHNIRSSDENENKRIANALTFLVKSASNMRLLFLSGTPMFNNYKEIIWLINIMNMNDRRGLIKVGDVFDAQGNFRKMKKGEYESGRDILIRKATGYVSFVRGENPYTFPYRIYPDTFAPDKTFNNISIPSENILGGKFIENSVDTITKTIFVTDIGDYQRMVYNGIMISHDSELKKDEKENDTENRLSYTKLQEPIQCLNISFPVNTSDLGDVSVEDAIGRGNIAIKQTIGHQGLQSTMDYIDDRSSDNMKKGDFVYKDWVQSGEHANFLSREKIGRYSSKMKNICDMIAKSKGVVLIYSQFLDGGLIPMALALEAMGITRYGEKRKSLFKTPPSEPVEYKTMQSMKSEGNKSSSAKYAMITGDKRLSPSNVSEILASTNDENKDGKMVKVILISMAGSEGVDLKFIRQVHILEPWYNMSRIEQIIGRAVRNNSHKLLSYSERNVMIFMYGTRLMDTDREAADVSVYRSAEFKAIQIGNVNRLLKEVSVDCFLNQSQANFDENTINQKVRQVLSNGDVLENYAVGDKNFSMVTDFMKDGMYKCANTMNVNSLDEIKVNNVTYDEKFIMANSQKIISKIKQLFKQKYFYLKDDLISQINYPKAYPLSQIYSALNSMIENEGEYLMDTYGRSGRLINIGDYYLFQPVELINPEITVFERSVPIQHKNDKIKIRMEIPSVMKDDLIRSQMPSNKNSIKNVVSDKPEDNLDKVTKIVKDMYDQYSTAVQYYTKPETLKPRDTLYKHVGVTMNKMKNSSIMSSIENEESKDTAMYQVLVEHLMDNISVKDKMSLFLYLQSNPDFSLGEEKEHLFVMRIRKYFDNKKYTFTNSSGSDFSVYIFFDPNVKSTLDNGIYYVSYNDTWKLAEYQDREDIKNYINDTWIPSVKDNIHSIFSFMSYGKTNSNIADYKIKEMSHKRSTGSKCNDIATKKKKTDILKNIISQSFDKDTPDDNIETVMNDIKGGEKDFSMKEVCIFAEFISRYYENNLKGNKHWFFTYEQHVMLHHILNVV